MSRPISIRNRSRFASAFEEFIHNQSSSGILLLFCTIIALIWANTPYGGFYEHLRHIEIGVHFHDFNLDYSLQHWVNDGLMGIFFLLVGLEIKREILTGELSSFKTAFLPIVAAVGGMIVPAFIYIGFNWHSAQTLHGWAIPMATDIAFAIGLLSVLSNRIPRTLLILLTAIAIVDDMGAVLVIATVYSKHIQLAYLYAAASLFLVMLLFNRLNVFRPGPYLIFGLLLWLCLLQSGVHATIAGILIAIAIPARAIYRRRELSQNMATLSDQFDHIEQEGQKAEETRKAILQEMEHVVHGVQAPLQRLEHRLQIPVNFVIIPIFVLLNAGVSWQDVTFSEIFHSPLTLGIILGLVIGKLIGIFGSSFAIAKIHPGALPTGIKSTHLSSLGLMAGIGFTMSIFIAELAFSGQPHLLDLAKLGILLGSCIAAILGFISMLIATRRL